MRLRMGLALALSAGICASLSAQDGGKIPWKGKSGDEKAAMADAQKSGKAMMMFFTAEG
jgi:hypothetical protein